MTDLYQVMLGMMTGGEQAAGARSSLLQMVNEQEGMDPTTRALLARALAPSGEEEPSPPPSIGRWSGGGDPRRRNDAMQRLRSRFDALRDELEELRERQDRLALALGACADCWGEDPECEACGGVGTSGSFVPDPRLYRALVAPACRAVGARRERRLVGVIDPPSSTHATGGVT
jgi:hypothetical protein